MPRYHNNRNRRSRYPHHGHRHNHPPYQNQNQGDLTLPKPYGFSEIDTKSAVTDTPVSRSQAGDLDQFYTGSLDITLTTLTPLIVGNLHQKQEGSDKQSKLKPQRLDDGRILINASSLKGMLRAALSRLLHAPMEKVAEHHYTFRPNLAARTKGNTGIVCLPAVVLKPGDENTPPQIGLLATQSQDRNNPRQTVFQAAAITFIKHQSYKILKRQIENLKPGTLLSDTFEQVKLTSKGFKNNLETSEQNSTSLNHILLRYSGGLDGEGILNTRNGIYRWVLVDSQDYEQAKKHPFSIPQPIWKHYQKTQDILADDKKGHLAPDYPRKIPNKSELQSALKAQKRLEKDQLIYVEVKLPNLEIISLGHNYHYRWAYTSSVWKKGDQPRPELSYLPEETTDDGKDKPQTLAANRLLFGYSDKKLDKKDWQRMAGRIAPNHAIECLPEGQDGQSDDRFLDQGKGICLKPLGKPRPSAVEFYLKQKISPKPKPYIGLKTYGDTVFDKGGDLAGRKYYHHQSKAKDTPIYQAPSQSSQNQDTLGTTVYCLSKPGTQFRFRLHFEQLRLWELGALLAVIEPQRLANLLKPENNRTFAHKLGYGKPLGLGSVQLNIDHWRYLGQDFQWQKGDDPLIQKALQTLQDKMNQSGCLKQAENWLNSLDFNRFEACDYPKQGGQIFKFHTTLRRAHINLRRGESNPKPDEQETWSKLNAILNQEENKK